MSEQQVAGGGDVAADTPLVAPSGPDLATTPADGAQPTAPDAEVTGGGATTYETAQTPVQCGAWVPAPVVVEGPQPTIAPDPTSGSDSPPDPIAGPTGDAVAPSDVDGTNGPAAAATTPATQLSTWPEWQAHFTRLGLPQSEIGKIGAANLTDAQLAEVYEQIHTDIVEAGGIPGQTPLPGGATSAWSPAWEQRFTALGLPADFVAAVKAEALKTGADETKLQSVYDQTVAKIKAQQQIDPTSVPNGPGSVQPTPQQPAADQPGWNPQVEQAFRSLGMPDEVVQLYAQSGAPLSGLEAAYKHAAGRVEDFNQRGWMTKFTEAGVPPLDTWSAILGDAPAKDEDLEKILSAHNMGQRSIWQKGGQLATSLFPGGRFLQYLFGKEAVSGDKIDRTSPMEIGMAALSVASVFAAVRGGKNIAASWKALDGNLAGLNGVSGTLEKLGMHGGEVASVQDAALGATQTWGTKQKLLSLIPGTELHRTVVGLGHADAAATMFNNGGAAKILANDADGALQLATITQMFDDIKSGAVRVRGGSMAYLGPFKKGPIMTLGADKQGEIIKIAKNLRIGSGDSQLVGLMEMGGTKLGRSPEWLGPDAMSMIGDVTKLADVDRKVLGSVMAGNLARDLGGFGKEGFTLSRPLSYLRGLANGKQPSWYTELAATTQAHAAAGRMPDGLYDVLVNHKLFNGLADDAVKALANIDRTALRPEVAGALDDAVARLDDTRAAFEAAKGAGRLDDTVTAAFQSFDTSMEGLIKADPEVAVKVFGSYLDETALQAAQRAAVDSVRSEWLAAAATKVDDVAEVAADVAATTAAPAASAAAPVAAAAVDDATVAARELAELRAVNAARPANAPVVLTADAAGHARTPAGLIVPSYASPVTGFAPAGADEQSIARLAAAFQTMRA